MKKTRTYVKPATPINYIIRYAAHDDTKHKIMNSNLSEIKKTERFLREKGVKDIDISLKEHEEQWKIVRKYEMGEM